MAILHSSPSAVLNNRTSVTSPLAFFFFSISCHVPA
nr:MAG TPA: hypothetical protein [Caudoviricetes sp.]